MSLFGKKVYNFSLSAYLVLKIYLGGFMKPIYLMFAVVLLFSGCSYKYNNLYTGDKKITEQSIANTKKSQILRDGKVRIFITVTYLNSLENQKIIDKNKEQFVVGFHFVNLNPEDSTKNLEAKDIEFHIGGQSRLVHVQKIKPDSPILQIIPASNPWSQYFLVQTSKIDKNVIKFSLRIFDYKPISLRFTKDY